VESFKQATIKVEKQAEFAQLRSAIDHAFDSGNVGRFLEELKNKGLRVRDWDGVLARCVLEINDRASQQVAAKELYASLTVSDQAQVRELYLSRIEEVDPKLRIKFHKIYQYY
jgi:hypothetical protein